MKRFLVAISALALMVSASGCCHSLCGRGCGAPPPACGPCGGNYGGYPAYSQAYAQPAYSTAAVSTGFATAAAPACNNCAPAVAPY